MTTPSDTPVTRADLADLRGEMREHFATKEYVLRVNLTTAALILAGVALIVRFLG